VLVIMHFTAHKQIYSCKQQYNGDNCRIFVDDCQGEDFKRRLFARRSPSGVFISVLVVCLSPSCHHARRCGRLHARLPVLGRLERRRGRRRGRRRCYRLEIVVGVISKWYGRYVTALATSPGLEPGTTMSPRPRRLNPSTGLVDDVRLWRRS